MRKSLCLLLLLQSSSLLADAPGTAKITDWLGAGSGCRGRAPDVGDLRMNVVRDAKNPLRLEVNFTMGSYQLSGDKPISPENQSFARECSLRFAIAPQANTRVKSVEAKTAFLVHKDKGVGAEIHSRLLTPQGTLVDWERIFESKQAVKNESVAMHLIPNDSGMKILAEAACGAPKILGADFTFESHRKSFRDKVEMKHDHANQVNFVVYLEPCTVSKETVEKKLP